MPAIISVAAADAASVHPAPTLMVTVVPLASAVVDPVQPVNADPSATVGCVGIPNPEANTTVMVPPVEPGPALKPTVQVVFVTPANMEEPPKVTSATPEITTGPDGEPGPSTDVATENDVLGYDPAAAGLVMPAIIKFSGPLNVQPDPTKVIVTVWPTVDPDVGAVVQVNADPRATAGVAGMTKPPANVTEMVSESVKEVAGANPIVQVVVAPATCDAPEKVTPDTGVAAAGSASRPNPRPPRSNPSERPIGRALVRRCERSRRPVERLHVGLRNLSMGDHSARSSWSACRSH
jgi:hypothetical protein